MSVLIVLILVVVVTYLMWKQFSGGMYKNKRSKRFSSGKHRKNKINEDEID